LENILEDISKIFQTYFKNISEIFWKYISNCEIQRYTFKHISKNISKMF